MPDFLLNSDAVISAAFSDASGPLTGLAANFTVTVTNRRTGASVATGAPTENPAGSGLYEFTVNSALLTAPLQLKAVYSNVTDELYAEQYFTVGVAPPWARTRRELRGRVARRLWGDERVWQEQAASGTTTTAVLNALVIGGDNEYRGLWAWFGDGANRGEERRVTAFEDSAATLTFGPALASALAADDWVELYPIRPSRINAALNDAIAMLRGHTFIEVDEQVLATDGSATEWTLPSDAYAVVNVGLVRDQDSLFLGWFPRSAWQMLPNRVLRVDAYGDREGLDPLDWGVLNNGLAAGYTLRLRLLTDVQAPLYDESLVDVDPDALVDLAALDLAISLGLAEPDRYRPMLPFLAQRAEQARLRAKTSIPPGTREVLR